ncbi:MAG: DNA recombination protein RmuC [Aureispira sp.]|nr:DNA recombination protein RmuC [Aureispira sp.]
MELIYLFAGVFIGLVIGFLLAQLRVANKQKNSLSPNEIAEKYIVKELHENNLKQIERLEMSVENKEIECIDLNKAIASQEQLVDILNEKLKNQEQELMMIQEQLRLEFENTANKLLEEKSRRFTEQNQENINAILVPLNEKIKAFEQKVELFYVDENKQRATLAEQLRHLTDLNQVMTKEAKNLTNALKGETKTQGNWGELILERILEKSGLTKGREYMTQSSFQNEEGRRRQPDLVIHLPNKKHIIIDSKVSLTAYERYNSDETEDGDKANLKAHINSIKTHVKELSGKNYQQLYGLNSLDFVLMFVPIEPAFILVMQEEPDLFYQAFEQNIVIVSPTTLLATTRTISNIWRQEQQNQNAKEIARQGGLLYDKFVLFIEDLELVGNRIQGVHNAYQGAMNKLQTGRGNLIQRTQRLQELGAKVSKHIPEQYLDPELEEEQN